MSLGVLEPLSLSELTPGSLGWRCDIRLSKAGETSRLYLVLSPQGTKARAESPLAGVNLKELSYRHAVGGDAGVELLLRSTASRELPRLRQIAEAIRLELEAE